MTYHVKGPGLAILEQNIRKLLKNEVVVGIPSGGAARSNEDGEDISNAMIGAWNEYGVPERNIPARPHLVPGIERIRPEIVKGLEIAAQAALIGDDATIDRQFNIIGLKAQASVRGMITETLSPALSPRTLYNRKNRKVAPRQGEQPLLDTGQYRNSLTYIVRPKGR